uniref:Sideroflexin-1 n=1 Tax=Triatoma infestans TaxID=30076 RepID=A0A170YFN5_TRIIF
MKNVKYSVAGHGLNQFW